jgi:acyl homoserine lactone synthase
MIILIDRHNAGDHPALMREMFRLRARMFGSRLGWDVRVVDGMERDRFDEENPLYVIDTDDGEHVRGSLRLLPTTGPTLFREFFADTAPDAAMLSSPSIWECTRFCVDGGCAGVAGDDQVVRTSAALIAALGELGLRAGIESYLGNFDALMIRLYRRIGCTVDILGQTDKFGRRVYLGLFPVSAEILRQVKARLADFSEASVATVSTRFAQSSGAFGTAAI